MADESPTSTDQMSPRGRMAVAAACLATGAGIFALAAGIVPVDEAKFQAPHWVVGACGFVFMLAGVMIMVPASASRTQNFLGAFAAYAWVRWLRAVFGPAGQAFDDRK